MTVACHLSLSHHVSARLLATCINQLHSTHTYKVDELCVTNRGVQPKHEMLLTTPNDANYSDLQQMLRCGRE